MRAAVAIVLAGCYGPTVATGVPCSSTGDCPQGQVCAENNRCELPGRDGAMEMIDVPTDAFFVGWSAPKPLVELNTLSNETDPTITGDGLDIVFASDRPGGLGGMDLYRASRNSISEQFGMPVLIAELSTAAADQAAELTSNGLTLYVRRVGTTMTEDIFIAQRQTRTSMFGLPTQENVLSSAVADTNPAISRDGLTFSTTRSPTATDRELYIHERNSVGQNWGNARQITELSTMDVESGAAFAQTGLLIIFHSDRDATTPDVTDLYFAVRPNKNQPFGLPTPIAELNTPDKNESDASITTDLRYIVFDCQNDLCFATR